MNSSKDFSVLLTGFGRGLVKHRGSGTYAAFTKHRTNEQSDGTAGPQNGAHITICCYDDVV